MVDQSVNGDAPIEWVGGKPIVIEKKKKKKKKYTKGLKDLQVSGRRVSAVSSDLARSVSKGIKAYRKASDKSADKKRDGALRDMGVNVAKGLGKSLRSASKLPADLAKAVDTRGMRRSRRRQTKALARLGRTLGSR